MTLRFGPRLPHPLWGSLDSIDRQRSALFWHFMGGVEGAFPTIDALLGSAELDRRVVRNENHDAVAVWWQLGPAGLLFAPTSSALVGEAIHQAFVARDPALWRSLAAARDRTSGISWEYEANSEPLWVAPPDPAMLVASIEVSGRTPLDHSSSSGAISATPSNRPAAVKSASAPAFAKGDRVRVLWRDKWWTAVVVDLEPSGLYRVSYEGFDQQWDESVSVDRVRPAPKQRAEKQKSEKKPVKKTVKKTAKKPAKKTAKKTAKRSAAKAGKKTAKKTVKKTVKKAAKKPAKKSAKKTVKKSAKKPAKKTAKKTVKKAAKKTAKKSAKKPAKKTAKKSSRKK